MLKWFGHKERMWEERLTVRTHVREVERVRVRGRLRRCKVGMREALCYWGLGMQEGEACMG